MKRLLVALGARYAHKGPAVWMLRAACAANGLAVDVLEADTSRPPGALLRDILAKEPDAVGFSCAIWNIELVKHITAALRRVSPRCVILWGGPEVSYDAAQRMRCVPAPDAILAGEAEETLPEVFARLEAGRDICIPGVVTRGWDGGVAPPVPPEKWPHLYPPGAVAEPHRLHYVETARGCPFRCRYCLSSVQGGVRALPAREAVSRLLSARDAGVRTVKVLDRTFNFDAPRAREIWAALMRAGGDSTYHFEIAAHLLGREDIALLLRAPKDLFQFEIGVQTTGQAALDAVERRQDFARLAEAVSALRAADAIHLHLDLIAGLPGDTYRDFAQAVDRVLALRPHALQLGFLKLLPGSPLRRDYDEAGIPYDAAPPYEVLCTPPLSAAELAALHDIEDVLSVCWNSGKFPRSARRLSRFDQLEKAALSLREEGFFDAPKSFAASVDALRRALGPEAEEDLRHDWLLSGRRDYRPWMKPAPV